MTKTNGFREIDFSKIECKNCGQFQLGLMPYHGLQTAGKILQVTFSDSFMQETQFKLEDCPVCKGTGFIHESGTESLLELDINPCAEVCSGDGHYDQINRDIMKKLIPDNTRLK